jgi:tetratricopeptide (TPR) repeat protein
MDRGMLLQRLHRIPLWLALLTIAAVAGLAYANVYANAFLFDDELLIVRNAYLGSFTYLADLLTSSSAAGAGGADSFYRPLQAILYLLTVQLFGIQPFAFHALNVLLHAGVACMVFLLGQKLGARRDILLIGTLVWVAHPIHTEAVAYMSATADPLHALLVLLGLYVWQPGKPRALFLSLLCFIAALLAKEAAIVFPALLCVLIFFRGENRFRWRDYWRDYLPTLPFWGMAALYLILRATVLDFDNTYSFFAEENDYTRSFWVRLYTFLSTLPGYLRLLLWPSDLHLERMIPIPGTLFDAQVLCGLLLVGLWIAALVFYLRGKSRGAFAFMGAWFFTAYFPCSGLVVPVNAVFLEHWMYLPGMGFVWGAAWALKNWQPKMEAEGIFIASAFLAVSALIALTLMQNATWKDPITFYTRILTLETGSARVHNNLAMAYDEAGQRAKAEDLYQRAIALWDIYPQTHHNYGMLLARGGRREEAETEFRKALAIQPDFAPSIRALKVLKEQER